ncbi:MAG: hypothetical protein LBS78_01675 [Endomicrobium sp.]|nr:hypothetical protein [Endomicrobium sp.]
MYKLSSLLLVIFCIVIISSFSDAVYNNVVVTGNVMEIKNRGDLVVSKGNTKAVESRNIIMADMLVYDKKRSAILASGNTKLLSKALDDGPIEAYCESAKYCISDGSAILWDNDSVIIKYFMHNLIQPIILHAHKVCVSRKQKILSAYDNVEVVTSFGTIYSDNVVFNEGMHNVVFKKDKKRPTANILYDKKKGFCEADEIFFCNSDNKRKIVMNGFVIGKIIVEDKI